MRSFLLSCSFLALPLAAAGDPLRVLVLGADAPEDARRTHVLMRELGREAIWFDVRPGAEAPAAAELAAYDAI